MAKTKTLYVNEKDSELWDKAKRLLAFHKNESLSSHLTKYLRKLVSRYENE